MELAAWLLLAAIAGLVAVLVLRRWRRGERTRSDGGFYAADSRRRDEDDNGDGDGGDGGGGD